VRPLIRVAVGLGCLAVLLTRGDVASAAETFEQRLIGSISPQKVGTPKRPRVAELTVETGTETIPPGGQPPTLTRAIVFFPQGARVNGRLFPSCRQAVLQREGPSGCRRRSRIGRGKAEGRAGSLVEQVDVTVFNGPRGRSVLFHIFGTSPINVQEVLVAPLVRLRGRRFGYRLTVRVPPTLQRPSGVTAAVTLFRVTVGSTIRHRNRRRGYLETFRCPRSRKAPLRGVFSFIGQPDERIDTSIACRS
jgi:hypothetical protein